MDVCLPVEQLEDEFYLLLQSNRKALSAFQSTVNDGVWLRDLQRDEEWHSAEFWQILGYQVDSANRPKHLQSILHPKDWQLAQENLKRHIQDSRHAYDQLLRFRHFKGTTVWLRCRGILLLDEQGRPSRMIGSYQNMTEFKQLEFKQAHVAQSLVKSNKELENFAYIASHDLQGPLRRAAGYIQLLQVKHREKLDEQSDYWIDRATENLVRMQGMVQDLLNLARLSSQLEKPKAAVRVAPVLLDIQDGLAQKYTEKKISLELQDELGEVFVTERHLYVVLENIFNNAAKYNQNQEVLLSVKVEDCDKEGFACLSFRDNGIGIAKSNQRKVFDIFKRLHAQNEYAGNGMGLAICKRILNLYGGDIRLDEHTKKGCKFLLEFPLSVQE